MSAEDPKKCCRVLISWDMEFSKYDNWSNTTVSSQPPNKRAVPSSATKTLQNSANLIISRVPPIPASLTRNGESSPRKVMISLDSEGTLQNAPDFNGERTVEGSGKTELSNTGNGRCKRLNSKSANLGCNCLDFNGGTLVSGSEICRPSNKELGSPDKDHTFSFSPRYICRGTVTWEQYRHGFGWTVGKEEISTTFSGPRIPAKITYGRTETMVCTVTHQKEMDCCL
jgi:hypothetical protein